MNVYSYKDIKMKRMIKENYMYDLIGGLERIILYHDEHPDKVVLLLGNHDLHYMYEDFHEYSPCDRYSVHYASLCLSRLSLRFRARREGHQRSISHVDINTRVHLI